MYMYICDKLYTSYSTLCILVHTLCILLYTFHSIIHYIPYTQLYVSWPCDTLIQHLIHYIKILDIPFQITRSKGHNSDPFYSISHGL